MRLAAIETGDCKGRRGGGGGQDHRRAHSVPGVRAGPEGMGIVSPGTSSVRPPLLRGYLHLAVAALGPLALVNLLLVAESPAGYVGAAVFGSSLMLLYCTSAARHLVRWRPGAIEAVRRIDHSMVLVFIAGSYTPFALSVMRPGWGISILSVVWGLAGAGMVLTLTRPDAPRWLRAVLFIAIGWVALPASVELATMLPATAFSLVVLGGALYSAGAVIYVLRRPNPAPRYFGHHELFHSLVVTASAVFYAVVAVYVLPS